MSYSHTAAAPDEQQQYLRALSLKQPFCSALLAGIRKQESRSWKVRLPQDGSGLWIAAHAPARMASDDALLAELRRDWPEMPSSDQLPRSAIIGFLHISHVAMLEDIPIEERDPGCNGPFVWCIDRTIGLAQPFPCAGQLGMWTPPKELPLPEEVLLHCQSDAVLAAAPVPRKSAASKAGAAALSIAAGVSADSTDEHGEKWTRHSEVVKAVPAPAAAPKRKRPPKGEKLEKVEAGAEVVAAGHIGRVVHAPLQPGQGDVRVLKVKRCGERWYREVRTALPCGYERLAVLVANKFGLPAEDVDSLVLLPDVLVAADEDVAGLPERAELVVYFRDIA